MKAITYRINLYPSIGKFSFDMTGEKKGVACALLCNVRFINNNNQHYKKCNINVYISYITEQTMYHYINKFVVKK